MKYKAVFFDFDGTLMDSSEGIISCGQKAMNELGVPIPEDADLRRFIGPPLEDCFRITFRVNDPKTLEKLCTVYRAYYAAEGRYKAKFYPHMVEVLNTLKQKGYKLGVASMKLEKVLKQVCDVFDLTDVFDYIGGMNDNHTDTKSDIVIRGCKSLGIDASDCVLVGDTSIDCEGAKKAGLDFIKVGWGFGYYPSDEGVINDVRDILVLV